MKPVAAKYIATIFLALFACSVVAYDVGEDVETRYGTLEAGQDPESQIPDRLLWRGEVVVQYPGYVAVEKIFEMDGYDVALIAMAAGGNSAATEYLFLFLYPDGTTKTITDAEMKSDDGTFEVSRSGDKIKIDFGFSGGLTRKVTLDGEDLYVASKKLKGPVPLNQRECAAMYDTLSLECAENPKSKCSRGTDTITTFSRSYLKAARQKPGFDESRYEQLCVSACEGSLIRKNQFESEFCGK